MTCLKSVLASVVLSVSVNVNEKLIDYNVAWLQLHPSLLLLLLHSQISDVIRVFLEVMGWNVYVKASVPLCLILVNTGFLWPLRLVPVPPPEDIK